MHMIDRESRFNLIEPGEELKPDAWGNFQGPDREIEGAGTAYLSGLKVKGNLEPIRNFWVVVLTPQGIESGPVSKYLNRDGLFEISVFFTKVTYPTRLASATLFLPEEYGELKSKFDFTNMIVAQDASQEEINQSWWASASDWRQATERRTRGFFATADVEQLAKLQVQLSYTQNPRRLRF
jgi:hypothetical protein